MKRILQIALPILSILSILLAISGHVSAETQQTQKVVLSPAIIELMLAPGEKKTIKLTVTNKQDEEIDCEVNISELKQNENNGEYELRKSSTETDSIIAFPSKKFSIEPDSNFTLPADITMPDKPTSDSYYPVILIKIKPKSETNFSTVGELGSILYVNLKEGYQSDTGDKQGKGAQMKIEVNVKRELTVFPVNEFSIKIENTGNTYTKPFGNLAILSPANLKLKDLPVNQKLKILLPGQDLESELSWKKHEGKNIWRYIIPEFGKHTVAFGIDDGKDIFLVTDTFWVIPIYHITLVVLILFVFVVRFWNKKLKHRGKS
ncbi:DUF916 domain-containing protein [Candidatus Dojkabacteria bacterium]|nr:DUF916 domain-containing protein [Candidatus Dojkabacteria bacterium]